MCFYENVEKKFIVLFILKNSLLYKMEKLMGIERIVINLRICLIDFG